MGSKEMDVKKIKVDKHVFLSASSDLTHVVADIDPTHFYFLGTIKVRLQLFSKKYLLILEAFFYFVSSSFLAFFLYC